MNVVWFNGWDALLRTVIAGSVTYLALVLLLRLSGPRTLAKWYAFDLIVTVALGSTFANGVLSKDIAISQALIGFVLLILLQYVVGRLFVHFPWFVRIINPPPVLLLVRGELLTEAMSRNRVTRADVCKAARSSGNGCLEEVDVVVLEPDGSFTVVTNLEIGRTSALDDIPEFTEHFRKGAQPGRSSGRDELAGPQRTSRPASDM